MAQLLTVKTARMWPISKLHSTHTNIDKNNVIGVHTPPKDTPCSVYILLMFLRLRCSIPHIQCLEAPALPLLVFVFGWPLVFFRLWRGSECQPLLDMGGRVVRSAHPLFAPRYCALATWRTLASFVYGLCTICLEFHQKVLCPSVIGLESGQ